MKLACPACSRHFAPKITLYSASVYAFEFSRLTERRYYLCRECSREAVSGTEAGRRAVRALLEFAANQIDGGGT